VEVQGYRYGGYAFFLSVRGFDAEGCEKFFLRLSTKALGLFSRIPLVV
jgi:hypothetical protein